MLRASTVTLILLSLVSFAHAGNRVKATLVSSTPAALPGSTFDVAIHFTIPPGWHMYWINPGDTGAPPKVKWNLPDGVTATPVRFPAPRRIPVGNNLTAFGYEEECTLLSTISVDKNFDADRPIDLAANLQWVVCADECVMEKQDVSARIKIGPVKPGANDQFSIWRSQQPQRGRVSADDVHISLGRPAGRGELSVTMPHDFESATEIEFFPPPLDFVVFDRAPNLHAIVGGMMVTQPFRIDPGQHPPADTVAMLSYLDGKKQHQMIEVPFKVRFGQP